MQLEFWRQMVDSLLATWLGEQPALREAAYAAIAAPSFDGSQLVTLLSRWVECHADEIASRELHHMTALGQDNPTQVLLSRATGRELAWLEEYGLPVLEEERQLARFLFSYDQTKLEAIGTHIAEAFLHGFLSQSRERRGRRRVRLHYCVGQEAIAQQVVRALAARGLQAVVQPPSCLTHTGAWTMAHGCDRAACLSAPSLAAISAAYDAACCCHRSALEDTCGMIGIGQFGAPAQVPAASQGGYHPSLARRGRLLTLENTRREIDARYLAPSDLSFCKVAFPNVLVGEEFPAVFEAFYSLNTMNSEFYEGIQQVLIDGLDTCAAVELTGVEGNRTALWVNLRPLSDGARETNFLNCGGDLNIPHGEIFTTPVLAGTHGRLHVREIYLKGVYFKDLELTFHEGMITDYCCGNCSSEAEGHIYVQEHLLQHHDTLPMGEFAIGSNTLAYAIARDMDLMPRMPILLAEKMGPHIAVGDPCFARGEDAPVYNLLDGKEMTARENERTAHRETEEVYTNVHTDITLAFDELASLTGVRHDGSRLAILQDGRFVLPGTQALNTPLRGKEGVN